MFFIPNFAANLLGIDANVQIVNIPTFIALRFRIKIEEELLESAFGDDYKKRSKRIIPGVY